MTWCPRAAVLDVATMMEKDAAGEMVGEPCKTLLASYARQLRLMAAEPPDAAGLRRAEPSEAEAAHLTPPVVSDGPAPTS